MQQLPDPLPIALSGPVHATVRPPGSKSITNRALVCAALAHGASTLTGVLDSDDTRVMIDCLRRLGIVVSLDADTASLEGCDGRIPANSADLFVGNSGTTVRFLTAMLSIAHGVFRLDGTPRMRERPIGDLIRSLEQLGTRVTSDAGSDCPPVTVRADGLRGGRATIRGDVSSQFLSGLLMAAPYADAQVELAVAGELVSQPYVRMTLEVMRAFGVEVARRADGAFLIPTTPYRGRNYAIEPDASAASYFWAAAAIAGGQVAVAGLTRESLQGDVGFVEVLARMGCTVDYAADRISVGAASALRGVEVDMNAISDTVQSLAAVALFADGPTKITGVAHIRHKETDRVTAVATELRKFGAHVEEYPDGLKITPGQLHGATIDTYDDHRMAMSMALVGLRVPGVAIRDPGCTAKTYPCFFDDLARVTAAG